MLRNKDILDEKNKLLRTKSKDKIKSKVATKIGEKLGFEINKNNFKINKYYDKNHNTEIQQKYASIDCQYGRILTSKGVYTCPFLANDHRGRSGSNFRDFSRKNVLETGYCAICTQNKNTMFAINNIQ